MFHRPVKFLFIASLILAGFTGSAQTSTVSNPLNGRENDPYTKYGIGSLENSNNTVLRGMGNITSAYASPTQVNTDNPASYSFLTRTTFEAGATASTMSVNGTLQPGGAGASYRTGTATLSYINIAFPIKKIGGICLGFRPYSRVYYSLADTIGVGTAPSPIGQVVKSYNGEGSIDYAFIGYSMQWKGLSIGANLGYMFGNIRNTTATIPIDTLASNYGYNAEFSNYTKIGSLEWRQVIFCLNFDLPAGRQVCLI